MQNEQEITIKQLAKCFKPTIWDSTDKITNLSDATVGYYAYLMQEYLFEKDVFALPVLVLEGNGFDGKLKRGLHIRKPLELIESKMEDVKIAYIPTAMRNWKEMLDNYLSQEEKLIVEMGKDNYNLLIAKTQKAVDEPYVLHNYELFFSVVHKGIKHPVVLRNGYLLMCLKEAEIKSFEELDGCKAVMIFNSAVRNPHICSFVKFEKIK
jgi:hypothetical protein